MRFKGSLKSALRDTNLPLPARTFLFDLMDRFPLVDNNSNLYNMALSMSEYTPSQRDIALYQLRAHGYIKRKPVVIEEPPEPYKPNKYND